MNNFEVAKIDIWFRSKKYLTTNFEMLNRLCNFKSKIKFNANILRLIQFN